MNKIIFIRRGRFPTINFFLFVGAIPDEYNYFYSPTNSDNLVLMTLWFAVSVRILYQIADLVRVFKFAV